MKVEETSLSDVFLITPRRFEDARGWFSETWNAERMNEAGLSLNFVQDNHSYSARKGTLRGLHYQSPPHAQDKLVRCTRGAVLDVAVDFRDGSPDFARWVAVELSADNGCQLLIPKGFLHGFLTLVDETEVQYKCTGFYDPECDGCVRWNDPTINIDWSAVDPIPEGGPFLSEKDASAPILTDLVSPFNWKDSS